MKLTQLSIGKNQMRYRGIAAALLLAVFANAMASIESLKFTDSPSTQEQESLDAVSQRIAGYNAHDIELFLAAHSKEVRIYEYPDKKIGIGRKHLRRIFGPQFEDGEGHVVVLKQIVIGNRVVSYENITIGPRTERLVTVYTVEEREITSLRLIE